MKKPAENSNRGRRIYIIEIMPRWHSLVAPELPDGKQCFYVGETGKELPERYFEHRTGQVKPGRNDKRRTKVLSKIARKKGTEELVNKADISLRLRMSDRYESVKTNDESEALEASVIDELRGQGHAVYPDTAGSVPFDSYQSRKPGALS